jgi:peptide deformylase
VAILKIARMGNPALRRQADPIEDARDPAIQTLLADMVDTMRDADGTGLAATQVHANLAAVVYYVEKGRGGADQEAVPLTKLINPVVTPLDDAPVYDWEGCLSVPGLIGLVPRPPRIHMSATTPDGDRIDREYEGFHARVLQHECDHLAGILYPQRMDDLSLLLFREELRHGVPEKAKALLTASE